MPFPIMPDAGRGEPESGFTIHDPFRLRRAVTPVFVRDLRDGMFTGYGTSFYVTPFGHQLSAMHVATDFFNERGIRFHPGVNTPILQGTSWIGIHHDPGLVYGTCPAGNVLYLRNFVMFPVDQTKHPLAITFTADQLGRVEPALDLISWDVDGLSERRVAFLPVRIGQGQNVKKGDFVMAVGYDTNRSWRRPRAQIVTYQAEMRGSIGRVIQVHREWNPDRKIWPNFVVDVCWPQGMSGGPVFNEDGAVIGIVSRGADECEGIEAWSSALWLEVLPYRSDIFGCIDPRTPGWVCGWGVCNPNSMIELFQTQDDAEAFVRKSGSGLSVRRVSTPYPTGLPWGQARSRP
jgi:serine protease Do